MDNLLYLTIPPDLIRFLVLYLEPCDIFKFLCINRKNYMSINNNFLKDLGYKYLTTHEGRLTVDKNILRENIL